MTNTLRPTILAVGIPELLLKKVKQQAGLLEVRDSIEGITTSDWDLLLIHGEYPRARLLGFRHVLHFYLSTLPEPNDFNDLQLGRIVQTRNYELEDRIFLIESPVVQVAGTPNETINGLLQSWRAQQTSSVHHLICYDPHVGRVPASAPRSPLQSVPMPKPTKIVTLISVSTESHVHAYRRISSRSDLMRLPDSMLPQVAGWVSGFIETARDDDPSAFPAPTPDWRIDPTWSPVSLEAVTNSLEELETQHEAAKAEFNRRRDALNEELEQQLVIAASGAQRLLTEQGDKLEEAVVEVLKDLGFGVRDMDDHHDQKTGAKLEDLRVTDPAQLDWNCLVEVKGYNKGAKVSDVGQIIGRPLRAYLLENRKDPESIWHIVNTERNTSPDDRKLAIPNSAIDLSELTKASGCLIDTRDLFKAWKAVEAGRASKEEVRESLRSGVTRWIFGNN